MAKNNNNQSKYKSHYSRLIKNAQARDHIDGYFELHHIVPRCMGGADDPENIVRLTAREHFVAHRLLAHAYTGQKIAHKLWYAVWMMAGLAISGKRSAHWKRDKWRNVRVCSRTYEKAKEMALSGDHPAAVTMSDHTGSTFNSISDMAAKWGLRSDTYRARRGRGWTKKKALETPVGIPGFSKCAVYDHLNKRHGSQLLMCRHWGIPPALFCSRTTNMGWSVEKALTTKPAQQRVSCVDHKGNEFKSKSDMFDYWSISGSSYRRRRKLGWSKRKSLETQPGSISQGAGVQQIDHQGNIFKSLSEMARYWGIGADTLTKRIRGGWDIESALTVVPSKGNSAKHMQTICRQANGEIYDSQ